MLISWHIWTVRPLLWPLHILIYFLSEDNNTRVVFERILTSSSLPEDRSQSVAVCFFLTVFQELCFSAIWDRYLEFESLVGDLTGTLKVDARRREVRKDTESETLLLIDRWGFVLFVSSWNMSFFRYRFLDLVPCTHDQLKLMGYKVGFLLAKFAFA